MTELINSNCDDSKTQGGQNSNCEKKKTLKQSLYCHKTQNSIFDKTQIATKLKLNSNKTQ